MQAKRRSWITDDLDVQWTEAAAKRLDRRLLRREARSEVAAGACPGLARTQLVLPKQPEGEPWAPLQSPFDPIDLDQVDPERRNARGGGQGVITADEVESPSSAG